jgi:hypothetical protein
VPGSADETAAEGDARNVACMTVRSPSLARLYPDRGRAGRGAELLQTRGVVGRDDLAVAHFDTGEPVDGPGVVVSARRCRPGRPPGDCAAGGRG